MEKLDQDYWNNRYLDNNFPWDLGKISNPLRQYIDQLENKNLEILIPGAGNGHEATYLFDNGFKRTTVVDWSEAAVNEFKNRTPGFPASQVLQHDFFTLDGQYDLVIEQTFLCALDAAHRAQYAEAVSRILKPGGKLAGVLFGFPFNPEKGPPFGGDKALYSEMLSPWFEIKVLEACHNSEPDRVGSELFLIAHPCVTSTGDFEERKGRMERS